VRQAGEETPGQTIDQPDHLRSRRTTGEIIFTSRQC
jgi:hypothetical protein